MSDQLTHMLPWGHNRDSSQPLAAVGKLPCQRLSLTELPPRLQLRRLRHSWWMRTDYPVKKEEWVLGHIWYWNLEYIYYFWVPFISSIAWLIKHNHDMLILALSIYTFAEPIRIAGYDFPPLQLLQKAPQRSWQHHDQAIKYINVCIGLDSYLRCNHTRTSNLHD